MSDDREVVLVTGSTGFIGQHLVPKLAEDPDYDVHVLERYITGRYSNVARNVATHFADLREAPRVAAEVKLLQPEIVVHLAALSAVSYSYDHPNEVIESNLTGTVNLAEALRQHCPGLKHLVAAGSTEEYGITPYRPAMEDSKCLPNSPYAVSKHAQTEYLLYMNKAYGMPIAIMRPTNTYGRKNDDHFFVERMVSQIARNPGGEVQFGEDEAIRDFMYVDDHVEAYLSVLKNREKTIGEIFNFSTGKASTIREVLSAIAEVAGFKGRFVPGTIPRRPLDIHDHRIDPSKAKTVLGWEAKWPLKKGLAETFGFWKQKFRWQTS